MIDCGIVHLYLAMERGSAESTPPLDIQWTYSVESDLGEGN